MMIEKAYFSTAVDPPQGRKKLIYEERENTDFWLTLR
jgi:hypothetical protein